MSGIGICGHFKRVIIWALLGVLGSVSDSHAQTPPQGRLALYEKYPHTLSSAEMTQPRAKGSKTPEISAFLKKYSYVSFRHAPLPPMAVEPGSLAFKENQLAYLIMDIRFLNAPASRFVKGLQILGEKPSAAEVVEFISEKKGVLESLLGKFGNLLSRDSPVFAERVRFPIGRFQVRMGQQMDEITRIANSSQSLDEILRIAHRMETDFSGLMGELYMAIALPGALSVSTKVRDIPEFRTAIADLRAKIDAKVLAHPEEWVELEREFPLLFLGSAQDFKTFQSLSQRLEWVWERIGKEEVDVFRKVGAAYFIGEAKMSAKPFDAESFQVRVGHHSRAEQAESKRQLAKFLNLAGLTVHYDYMVSAGFDAGLAQELKNSGWKLHFLTRGCSGLAEKPSDLP
jgi:hypothetical protein